MDANPLSSDNRVLCMQMPVYEIMEENVSAQGMTVFMGHYTMQELME